MLGHKCLVGGNGLYGLALAIERCGRLPVSALDIGELAVGPQGKALYLGLSVFPDCDDSIPCTVKRLDARAADKASGLIFDQVFIRHWDTWKDGRRSHVFTLPAGGGEPVDVMAGMDADCPAKPFGGPEDYTFAPDNHSIVFAARDAGADEPWSTNFDIYVTHAKKQINLTEDNEAWDAHPVFSPDGTRLAWQSMLRPGF